VDLVNFLEKNQKLHI
jgi:hypothetical protein